MESLRVNVLLVGNISQDFTSFIRSKSFIDAGVVNEGTLGSGIGKSVCGTLVSEAEADIALPFFSSSLLQSNTKPFMVSQTRVVVEALGGSKSSVLAAPPTPPFDRNNGCVYKELARYLRAAGVA